MFVDELVTIVIEEGNPTISRGIDVIQPAPHQLTPETPLSLLLNPSVYRETLASEEESEIGGTNNRSIRQSYKNVHAFLYKGDGKETQTYISLYLIRKKSFIKGPLCMDCFFED